MLIILSLPIHFIYENDVFTDLFLTCSWFANKYEN